MTEIAGPGPYRVLVVDDDASLRETYRHILMPPPSELGALEALIAGNKPPRAEATSLFQVLEADQGETAAILHRQALARGEPCQVAFIDMRMPPGWDGLRTAVALRAQDPTLYVVIATAFSDYDVNALQSALGHDVVLLRKPFNQEEVFQLARTLCQSWETRRRLELLTARMEERVRERTRELEQRTLQQAVLAEIATRMVELTGYEDCDDAVHWCLAHLGRLLDADGCALLRLDPGWQSYSMTHEWTAFGVPSMTPQFQHQPLATVMPIHVRLVRDDACAFSDLAALPTEMADLGARLAGHYHSLGIVPVQLGGQLVGALAIGHTQPRSGRDGQEEALLRTAGHILFRALEAHEQSRALLEQSTRLDTVKRLAHIGTWSLDAGSRQAIWDEEVRHILGIGPEVPAGPETLAGLCHPEDRPALLASLDGALARGTLHQVEYRVRRPDGQERLLRCWGRPERGPDGGILGLTGMIQDITEFIRRAP